MVMNMIGSNMLIADTDGDGLSDGVEVEQGRDPLVVEVAKKDEGCDQKGQSQSQNLNFLLLMFNQSSIINDQSNLKLGRMNAIPFTK